MLAEKKMEKYSFKYQLQSQYDTQKKIYLTLNLYIRNLK